MNVWVTFVICKASLSQHTLYMGNLVLVPITASRISLILKQLNDQKLKSFFFWGGGRGGGEGKGREGRGGGGGGAGVSPVNDFACITQQNAMQNSHIVIEKNLRFTSKTYTHHTNNLCSKYVSTGYRDLVTTLVTLMDNGCHTVRLQFFLKCYERWISFCKFKDIFDVNLSFLQGRKISRTKLHILFVCFLFYLFAFLFFIF